MKIFTAPTLIEKSKRLGKPYSMQPGRKHGKGRGKIKTLAEMKPLLASKRGIIHKKYRALVRLCEEYNALIPRDSRKWKLLSAPNFIHVDMY